MFGDVCGDGSGRDVQVAEFRRCGWSLCQVAHQGDGAGAIVASCYGPLPGHVQEVPKSELYGLYMTLVHAIPPVHYHTDCKWVVDGFHAGREGTVKGHHTHADLWCQVWDKVDDIGRLDADGNPNIRVSWIKGHTTQRSVAEGKIKEWQRDGNRHADKQARAGAAAHPRNAAAVTKYNKSCIVSVMIAKFAARISARVHKGMYDATPDRRAKTFFLPRKKRAPKESCARHSIRSIGSHFVCWNCGSAAATKENLLRKPCVKQESQRHVLWQLGDFIFCTRCGGRTSARVRLLRKKCCGKPTSATTANTLKLLKKGRLPGKCGWVGRPTPVPWDTPRGDNATCPPCVDPIAECLFTPGLIGETVNPAVTWLAPP